MISIVLYNSLLAYYTVSCPGQVYNQWFERSVSRFEQREIIADSHSRLDIH